MDWLCPPTHPRRAGTTDGDGSRGTVAETIRQQHPAVGFQEHPAATTAAGTRKGGIIDTQAGFPASRGTSLWRLPAMRLLAGYTLGGAIGFSVTLSALPAYLAAHGTPDSLAGLVTTALLAATVCTQLLAPRLVQWFGMAGTLAGGLIALGAPSLLLLLNDSLAWAVGVSALRGAGFGILTVLGSTMTARIVPISRRGEAIGIYGLAIAIPTLLATSGGVALVAAGQFPLVAILGAAPLLSVPFAPALARAGAAGSDDRPPAGGRRGRDPAASMARRTAGLAAIPPALVLLMVTLAGGGFLTYLPIARPDGALATIGLFVWGVTGALSRWRAGLIADRSGIVRLLPGGSGISAVGMGVVVAGLLLPGAAGWAVTLIGSAVLGIGYGAIQNLTLLAAFARAGQQQTATVSAVWNVGYDAGSALGAALVGALTAVITVPGAFAAAAGLVALSIPLARYSGRPTPGAGGH